MRLHSDRRLRFYWCTLLVIIRNRLASAWTSMLKCIYICFSRSRKLKLVKKPADRILFVGIAVAGVQPNSGGHTYLDSSSYGMWSNGEVRAAGQEVISWHHQLPASSITQADLFKKRWGNDKVFSAGDEVLVVLDCAAHSLTLQSPTVHYRISINQQHQCLHQCQWVLNVNFGLGEHQIKLLAA